MERQEELTELEKTALELLPLSLSVCLSLRIIVNFFDFLRPYYIFNQLSILTFSLCDYLKYHCSSLLAIP